MSQMLRTSREVRRSGSAGPKRRPSSKPPVEISAPADAGASVAEAEPVDIGAIEAVEAASVFEPPAPTPPTPVPSLDDIEPIEVEIDEEPVPSPTAPAQRPEEEVYQELVDAAEHVFAAAGEGAAPTEGTIIAALRRALEQLREGDVLLAETVRQRRSSETWPERAANAAVLAVRLGMEVKYDERRCLALGLCALMHDLGMTQIPDKQLNSQKFSDEQRQLLHQHPVESQKMVTAFGPAFTWIGKIVVQVHERHDGSGYPHGLKGDQIHEMARILGLVDTYEAMAHPRADRQARVTYNALKEIIDLRNSLFERKLIKALIHIVSIFPLGSLVKLNNGEIGRVIGTSRLHPTRPTLEILIDPRGRQLEDPRQINLEDEPMLYIVDPAIEEGVLKD